MAKPLDLEPIRKRAEAATPGPWRWFGNAKARTIYLATTHSGRRFVMRFARWGAQSAQPMFQRYAPDGSFGLMVKAKELLKFEVPYRKDISGIDNPDAEFIAHAREDVPALIAEVEQLRALVGRMEWRDDSRGIPVCGVCRSTFDVIHGPRHAGGCPVAEALR